MFNLFEHFPEMVRTNIDFKVKASTPSPNSVTLPDGREIPAAAIGHPETITHWMLKAGAYEQVSRDQAFAQNLWMHFEYGADMLNTAGGFFQSRGLSVGNWLTLDAMRIAVMSMPTVLHGITSKGFTEAEVWAYVQHETPWAVALVGVPQHEQQ